MTFGQGAGGNESRDSALQWKIHGAAAQPGCPSVPTTTTTTVAGPTTTTTTTLPGPSPLCPMDSTRTIFAGGPGTSACHQYDNNPTACEQAFHIGGECGAASCYMDPSGNCNGCGPNNEDNGACVNTCVRGGPSCPGDPSRTLFAGYAGTSACTYLSFSQALCEKAYQINGEGQPSSCFFDGFDCRGCGPNNLDAELCQNTCPVCEGDNARTTFLGGPGNSGCHKFDASQSSCEGAFLMGDSGAYTSCYYDSDNSQCNGCGPNNQSNGECINSCPVCADPGHSIFVGGPGTSACSIFSGNPTLCEQAFHVSGQCNELASCFYDFNYGDCLGCGPYNQGTGLCGNACAGPSCGNGIIDVAGEQCDGPIGCGVDELCSSACQCVSCSSTTIPAAGGVVTGTTFGLSAAASQCGYGTETAPEAVFAWTPNTTGYATIDACGSDFDTVMYLRVGSCGGTEDGCNDDGSCGVTSLLTPYVFAGTTYFIFLDGYYGNSGDFTLTVTPASPSGAFLDDVF